MPKKVDSGAITEPLHSEIPAGRAKSDGLVGLERIQRGLPQLSVEVQELQVFDEESYGHADELLGTLTTMRKGWKAIFDRIQEKTIKPIRAGLEELYQLNRDADGPLEKLEKLVKQKQTGYIQDRERKRLKAEQDARNEEAKLQAEADAKAKLAERAATPQMRGKLSAQAEQLMQKAATVAQPEPAVPIIAQHSSTRRTPKVRIIDRASFMVGIIEGSVHETYIPWDQVERLLNNQFKHTPDEVTALPGVEQYDEIEVVRR